MDEPIESLNELEALRRSNAELIARHAKDKARIAELEKVDVAELEKSWQAKFAERESELNGQLKKLKHSQEESMISQAVNELTSSLTSTPGNAALMALHVRQRLLVTYDGDTPMVRVRDASGNLSAKSVSDLQTEIKADPIFASIVSTSKASGSGGSLRQQTQQTASKPSVRPSFGLR